MVCSLTFSSSHSNRNWLKVAPVSTLTTRSALDFVLRVAGRSWPASLKATSLPSGDHAG